MLDRLTSRLTHASWTLWWGGFTCDGAIVV
jgi:hypothetical protein